MSTSIQAKQKHTQKHGSEYNKEDMKRGKEQEGGGLGWSLH
jgi:hypothetical protein